MNQVTAQVNLILNVKYSDISEQIGAHSIYLSRIKDRDDEKQGKIEFDFQKHCISLTSFSGYGFLKTRIKCSNLDVDKRMVKPAVVNIKDIQSLVKSFDAFNPEDVEVSYSETSLGFRLPSESTKKVKNSIRVYDVIANKVANRGRLREIKNADVSLVSSFLE